MNHTSLQEGFCRDSFGNSHIEEVGCVEGFGFGALLKHGAGHMRLSKPRGPWEFGGLGSMPLLTVVLSSRARSNLQGQWSTN